MNIDIKSGTNVAPGVVQKLYISNQWNDWLNEGDIEWYLNHSYYLATAWNDTKLIGIAVLVGDGRKYLELENLLVDKEYRRKGVAKALMVDVMQAITIANPYSVKIEVFEEVTEEFYQSFGFVRNKDTWLLELKSDLLRPIIQK